MEETKKCPLCKAPCKVSSLGSVDLCTVNCQVCGEYNIGELLINEIDERTDSLHIISGVVRNYFELHKNSNEKFVITDEMIENDIKFQAEFLSKEPKCVTEKAELLLKYIHRQSKHPGDQITIDPKYDYPLCFCKNMDELIFYVFHLKEIGNIEERIVTNDGFEVILTTNGWLEIDNLTTPNHESKQAFVAMWFDESMDEIFTNAILSLEDETGFKMLRIDQKHFNDKICDHIIAEIKQSKFMIADCTKTRPAVFFEAGYAMGFGLPVIFTCKEGTNIKECFDTDHYNHIVWKDAEDLKNKLKDRILATIAKA